MKKPVMIEYGADLLQSEAMGRDTSDSRDYSFRPSQKEEPFEPSAIDLSPQVSTVFRQGLHDCTVHTVAAALMFLQPDHMPSRRFLYFNMRRLQGTAKTDTGGSLRGALKALRKWGCVEESVYPYDLGLPWKPDWSTRPSEGIYSQASFFPMRYEAVGRKRLRVALAEGLPVMFAFQVPYDFMRLPMAKTGEMLWGKPMMRAGHTVLLVGLDDETETATALNSFGPQWGQHGFFKMPYKYLLSKKCYDFWVLRHESE